MKKIIFVRHAKSSWTSGADSDFDRPLNNRGRRDAPFMATKLKEIVADVDGIVKSPSKRTSQTADFFIEEYEVPTDHVLSEPSLYHGSLYDILDVVRGLPSEWGTVILFAHNPGMTSVAEYFGMSDVYNVPTCGISVVEGEVSSWADLNNKNSKVIAFEYPKKYFD